MDTPHSYGDDPLIEAHLSRAGSYDAVQRWAHDVLVANEWRGVPMVTVSLTRGIDGLWHGHVYGWPAAPVRPPLSAQGGDTEMWIRANPSAHRFDRHDTIPAGTLREGDLVDLGTIASHRSEGPVPVVPGAFDRQSVRAVPISPEAQGSFFVPNPAYAASVRAAREAEAEAARRSVYEDARPLELDLHTEAPPEKREGRRARREREVREAAEATAQQAVDAADAMAAAVTVPPSGHRPASGEHTAPVEWPVCTSAIEDPNTGERWVCRRKHDPKTPAPGLLHLNRPGVTWRHNDPRIIRTND